MILTHNSGCSRLPRKIPRGFRCTYKIIQAPSHGPWHHLTWSSCLSLWTSVFPSPLACPMLQPPSSSSSAFTREPLCWLSHCLQPFASSDFLQTGFSRLSDLTHNHCAVEPSWCASPVFSATGQQLPRPDQHPGSSGFSGSPGSRQTGAIHCGTCTGSVRSKRQLWHGSWDYRTGSCRIREGQSQKY